MAGKKCPYCGRRISYFTVFHEKKQGLHTCNRCKKESKIKTDMRLIVAFIAVVLLVIMFMVIWNGSGNYNSFWGVVITVLILAAFYFSTPLFIRFVPLKKYTRNSEPEYDIENNREEQPYFNREAFNEVKKRRTPAARPAERTVIREVPIIKNVSEAHASFDAPLKKVRTNQPNYDVVPDSYEEEEVRTYVPRKKPNGSRYTANRKF